MPLAVDRRSKRCSAVCFVNAVACKYIQQYEAPPRFSYLQCLTSYSYKNNITRLQLQASLFGTIGPTLYCYARGGRLL